MTSARQEVTQLLMARALAPAIDPGKCRLVELRYLGGLSVEETAKVSQVSLR